jgi:uncharacterized protein YeaO (DUF488 family)
VSRRSARTGVKLFCEAPEASDGTRVLVYRIWPRGLTKSMPARTCRFPERRPQDRVWP